MDCVPRNVARPGLHVLAVIVLPPSPVPVPSSPMILLLACSSFSFPVLSPSSAATAKHFPEETPIDLVGFSEQAAVVVDVLSSAVAVVVFVVLVMKAAVPEAEAESVSGGGRGARHADRAVVQEAVEEAVPADFERAAKLLEEKLHFAQVKNIIHKIAIPDRTFHN